MWYHDALQLFAHSNQPFRSPPLQEIRESLNLVRRDLASSNQKLSEVSQKAGRCPELPAAQAGGSGGGNCVSTTVFIALMVVQLVILIAYLMYR